MKLVISPAKSLDFESKLPTKSSSEPLFLKEAALINTTLKKQSAKGLSKLMEISDALAQLNYERNQLWHLPFTQNNARPAIYAFSGDVYKGLEAYTLKNDHIETLQNTVRILSGLYGLLKPLDLIQPYRLEMGTKLNIGKHKNLYTFWQQKVTTALNDELLENEVFVNLASQEYFKALDTKALKVPVVNVHFKEFKNGVYKNIAIFAKQARGLMARYIIETKAKTVEDLKTFNYKGYLLNQNLSKENELVFVR